MAGWLAGQAPPRAPRMRAPVAGSTGGVSTDCEHAAHPGCGLLKALQTSPAGRGWPLCGWPSPLQLHATPAAVRPLPLHVPALSDNAASGWECSTCPVQTSHHPPTPLQALADLCGGDPPKYARLLAALVAVDMTKSYADVAAGPA